MRIRALDWVRSSLSVKVLLIILLSHLLISYASITTHHRIFRSQRLGKAMENSVNFCRYIMDDIGSPPDTVRAGDLARDLDISIGIETGDFSWSSPPDMARMDSAKLSQFGSPEVRFGIDRGFQVEIRENGARYRFLLRNREESINYAGRLSMGLNLLYITFVLALIYIAVRWQLKSLGLLRDSVMRISAGELDFEIDSKRSDELGTLIRSFNAMRRRIMEMINSRDQLLLDVSHEFRSPLTRMKVSLEMMEESEERSNLIADINELEGMVTELLEGARLHSPHGYLELRETDLCRLMGEICREFKGKGPGVRCDSKIPRLVLTVDPARIRILFKNIIANAVKYSNADGDPVTVTVEDTGEEAVIQIRDYGFGIPERELPFIFEPFYRVDKSRSKGTGGYGLGMHLSKRIIDAHGGEISIDSQPGEGTTVVVRLKKQ